MTDFVEVWQCDPDGTNCVGPVLTASTEMQGGFLPEWLSPNHEFYSTWVETTGLILVMAIAARLVGKITLYSS